MPAEGQRAAGCGGVRLVPRDRDPRTARDEEEVGRDRRRRVEGPRVALPTGEHAVGEDRPVRRRGHRDREGGLDVGLVEARDDLLRDVHRGVGADVALVVGRVEGRGHAVAVGDVGHPGGDPDGVGGTEVGQRESPVVVRRRRPVERHVGGPAQLEEAARTGPGASEGDRGLDTEGVGGGEVEVDDRPDVGDEAGPFASLGQHEGHAAHPRWTARRLARSPGSRLEFTGCLGEGARRKPGAP